MKRAFILTLLVAGLVSCSKDSLSPATENYTIAKSELFVRVSYITWSDLACDLTCSGGGTQYINPMPNAAIDIYRGGSDGIDDSLADINGLTTVDGTKLFNDIEPGQYTVVVTSPLGQKTRTMYTHLHKRTSVEFSF